MLVRGESAARMAAGEIVFVIAATPTGTASRWYTPAQRRLLLEGLGRIKGAGTVNAKLRWCLASARTGVDLVGIIVWPEGRETVVSVTTFPLDELP
jgi:hypothetical protein